MPHSSVPQVRSVHIVNAGALKSLVQLLKDEGAAAVLGKMSCNSDQAEQITQAGALFPLVTILKEGREKFQLVAAFVLGNLAAFSAERCALIIFSGALQPLYALSTGESHSCKDKDRSIRCALFLPEAAVR